MRYWIIISLLLHVIVLAAYTFKISVKPMGYTDLSFIQVRDFKAPDNKEFKPVVEKREGDITPTEKPIIETNQVEQQASAENIDYTPFYLVEELPAPLSPIEPVYPEDARRMGLEGRVVMQIYIDASGLVRQVDIVKSPSPALSQAAKDAVMRTKFSPARVAGQNRAVCMQFSLKFRLE